MNFGEIQEKFGYWGETKYEQLHPATKEQRDTLMKAMTDAGYEWDAEKLELRKIETEAKELTEQEITEWSKEDEDTIKFLISHFCVSHCNRSFQFTSNKLITHDELLEKIRNLRPHWKPSDNQMNALDYYANSLCTYCDRQDDLRSLYNDLKKL